MMRPKAQPSSDAVKGRSSNHNAILIGVQPIARSHPDPEYLYADVALSFVSLDGWHRHESTRKNTDLSGLQFKRVAHAAIDDNARPTIYSRRPSEVAAHQRTAQRPTAIDHQHATFARRIQCGLHKRIVFKTLNSADSARKFASPSESPQSRRQYTKAATVVCLMQIAEIASREVR